MNFVSERSDDFAWANGRWQRRHEIHIPLDDLGIRQAVIAVERLRQYHGQWWQVDRHCARLASTLDAMGIDSKHGDVCFDVLVDLPGRQEGPASKKLNPNATSDQSENFSWGATILVTPGSSHPPAGVSSPSESNAETGKSITNSGTKAAPRQIVLPHRIETRVVRQRQQFGQPLVVTDVRQPPPESWPRSIKTRCRLHYFLADQQAHARQPGASGLLLDDDGSVTETSIANVAMVTAGKIFSPPAQRVLPGISQAVTHEIAQSLGIDWEAEPIFPAALQQADEVLLMGTDTGIWFASRVDTAAISNGRPGPVFRRLRAAWERRSRLWPEHGR
ncbi:MAG: aminotransferase class IV [Planctomycetota bacterium]